MSIFTRKYWMSIVPYRIATISDLCSTVDDSDTIIRILRAQNLVSEFYDLDCLAVDIWYALDRKPLYNHRRFDSSLGSTDPVIRMAYGIVVQALCDTLSHRPCDVNSWRVDHPPGDGDRCSPTTHICEVNAREFLYDICSTWEPILNLSDGTLVDIISKENGSVKSRSRRYLGS